MKFTEADIKDKALLEELITVEATRIFESPRANKGRTLDQVKQAVRQGKIAELYMVESGNYDFADIKWHDLKHKETGDYVEVKAYNVRNGFNAPFVQKDLQRYRTESWCKAKWYMLFSCHEGVYEFLGTKHIKG
jgi:hypothetical protein